jgi:iron-sulfur cluster assembly protein
MSENSVTENNSTITVTERAVEEVKKVMVEQGFNPDEYVLEAGVVGGGCSGFSYKLGFKEKSEVDPLNETVYIFHGVEVAVNNRAALYLQGAVIDFHEGLEKRGFVFNNPNAKTHCGCGSSFSA